MKNTRSNDPSSLLKNACWLACRFTVHRYLMSCAHGRWDGAEKAMRHIELCTFYVGMHYGVGDVDEVRREYEDDFQRVHDVTQELTDNLDTEIGFPLKSRPDYEIMAPLFFEKFHALAMNALDGAGMTSAPEESAPCRV